MQYLLSHLVSMKYLIYVAAFIFFLGGCAEDISTIPENPEGLANVTISLGGIDDNDEEDIVRSSAQDSVIGTFSSVLDDNTIMDIEVVKDKKSTTRSYEYTPDNVYRITIYRDSDGKQVYDSFVTYKRTKYSFQLPLGYTYTVVAYAFNSTNSPTLYALPSVDPDIANSYWTIASSDTSNSANIDYLFYKGVGVIDFTGANTTATINILFKHMLPGVRLSLNSTDFTISTTNGATAGSINSNRTTGRVNFNTTTPAVSNLGGTGTYNFTWPAMSAVSSVASNYRRVFPLTNHAPTVTYNNFTLSNGTIVSSALSKALSNITFVAGKLYTIKATIKKQEGIPAGGLTWAKANLYETAASTMAAPEYKIYSQQYHMGPQEGSNIEDLWNWGAAHPRIQSEISQWYTTVNPGVSAGTINWSATPITAATDPCRRALGDPWRIPTASDFSTLISGGYALGQYGGVWGVWFPSAPSPANDTRLFLPLSGNRLGSAYDVISIEARSGMVGNPTGIYWSSTMVAGSESFSKRLYMGTTKIGSGVLTLPPFTDPATNPEDNRLRSIGFAIRCVRN